MDLISQNAWLVALFPLLAALLIFCSAAFNREANKLAITLSLLGTSFSLIWALALLVLRLTQPERLLNGGFRWLSYGAQQMDLSWAIDNLSSLMLIVVTFVSLLVQIYSIEYMAHDKGIPRYYGALSLFTFSMLLLVLADNLLLLYAGWELVGVSSYLLIGFYTAKPEAGIAAKKAFIVNRVGDFGFLIGIMILFYMTQSLGFVDISQAVIAGKVPGAVLAIAALLLFFGPMGKSAQFPLHVWLPDAMEGPTPVSALIHAATMVAAGVYMVAKLMPIFAAATTPLFGSFLVLDFIAVIGGITAILAAAIAVTQVDIKRVLAYSTVSQLGFMMMALGMYQAVIENGKLVEIVPLGYTAGIFHLFTHAFFKAMLFLCSGAVIHAVHTNDMTQMGGLRKFLPVTAWTCLIGTASISGFPFLAGFWSKDELLLSMWEAHSPLFWLAAIAAVLTAFYMFRLYFMTFAGEYRGSLKPEQIHAPGWAMRLPLIILAVPSALAGFLGTPFTPEYLHFKNFIHYSGGQHGGAAHHAGFNPFVLGVSLTVFFVGAGLAWAMYGSARPKIDPKALAEKLKPLHTASFNRFYIDEVYDFGVRVLLMAVAKIAYFIDKYILDGMLVNGLGLFTITGSETLRYSQSGRIQHYLLFVIMMVVALILLFFWAPLGKVI